MLTIIFISFFAGILTVLAPCVLPLLPVILGGSLAGRGRARPYIIIGSLIASLLLFTLLLKASTVLIHVDPAVWEYVSGGLLILFSITLIFPRAWTWLMDVTGIENLSQNSLEHASEKEGRWWLVALGAALWPVFSSCNPTYTILLATILPVSMTMGLIGLFAYFIGLGLVLLLIVHFGRGIIGRFSFFTNPNGLFRRTLGVVILLVGILIITGDIKRLEAYAIEKSIFVNTINLDYRLNDIILRNRNDQGDQCADGKCDDSKESDLVMDLGRAPEFSGIVSWINLPVGQAGSAPLTLESLRGKVVLVDFWTYSCINCIRTQPYLNAWHEKYAADGLVIIGMHAPEFAFEKLERNVREAAKKAGIRYPVALDNDFMTWNAYGNRYWPAKYLIDQKGNIVYRHFGEGAYEQTEQRIQALLWTEKNLEKEVIKTAHKKTPETYLGSERADRVSLTEGTYGNGKKIFVPGDLDLHEFTLGGTWTIAWEYIESGNLSQLSLRFSARKVHLVVSFPESNTERQSFITTEVVDQAGNKTSGRIELQGDDLYTIVDVPEYITDGMLTLYVPNTRPIRLHAFTFWD